MKKINIYNLFYFFTYSLLMIIVICKKVDFIVPFSNVIHKIIPLNLLFIFFIQNKKISLKSLIYIFILIISFTITFYITDVSDLLYTFLFIISAKSIDVRKFIKFDIFLKCFLVIFVVIMYYNGHAENLTMIRPDGTIRNSLGLVHPNHFGLYLFSICCGIFYLNYNKIKLWNYAVVLISFLICYYVCDSRAAQFGIIILILFYFVLSKKKQPIFVKYTHFLPVILFAVSFIFVLLYTTKNPYIIKLDSLFSTRIKCANMFLSHYGINLFGHYFEFYGMWGTGKNLTVLDNSYMHSLIHYGLISFSIIMTMYIVILKNSIKEKKYNILVYLIPFLIYGLMERHIIEIQYNSILICASSIIYLKNRTKSQNNEEKNIENK